MLLQDQQRMNSNKATTRSTPPTRYRQHERGNTRGETRETQHERGNTRGETREGKHERGNAHRRLSADCAPSPCLCLSRAKIKTNVFSHSIEREREGGREGERERGRERGSSREALRYVLLLVHHWREEGFASVAVFLLVRPLLQSPTSPMSSRW